MDLRRNWILVDASSSQANAPIVVRDRTFLPSYSNYLTGEEQRIHNINRLNDRIQQRVASQTIGEGTARKGEKVINESFRFIDAEKDDYRKQDQDNSSASNRLDSLISYRDSQGEIEAVFERRQRPNPQELKVTPEMIYVEPENRYHFSNNRFNDIPYSQPLYFSNMYLENNDEPPKAPKIRRHYQDDRYLPSNRVPMNMDDRDREAREYYRLNNKQLARRPAHTLRRAQEFYDKCDLCAFKIFRSGDFCPACGRESSSTTRYLPRKMPSLYTSQDQILNARRLQQWNSRPIGRPPQYGRSSRTVTPVTQRYAVKSPVYRYGATVPESLYDYEVWARKSDKRRMQKRALGLAIALFAIALVVSAGVVLAAVNN